MYARIAIVLLAAAPALGQSQFLINDRATDAIYRVADTNANGVIDEPGEVNLYFNATNVPGTPGPNNPSCLGIGLGGMTIMGDQGNGNVYRFCDLNHDDDVQDAGESIVFVSTTGNAGAYSFAFPTGAAFDSLGRAYVTNAGNGFGFDRIFRLVDLNGDGDAQDAGEVTEYIGGGPNGFQGNNGAFSPQEIFFDENDVGYMHESATTFQGVWRFEDVDANGHADDVGEFTPFFTAANASGIGLSAGFALEPDRFRPGAIYLLQTATGSVDQLIRLTDANNDHDAQDAGEAVLAWSTAEANFTNIDVVSLVNGDVLITNNASATLDVIRLNDANGDDDFMDTDERTFFFTNNTPILGEMRQIAILPIPGDIDGDGARTEADIAPFVDVLLGTDALPMHVFPSDLNCDGYADGRDIVDMVALQLTP